MIWKKVKGYRHYLVSDSGLVRSLPHSTIIGKRGGGFIKPQNNGNGYFKIALSKNGKCKQQYIHRLVAEAFLRKPRKTSQVNHINGNKADNRAANLEWVTPSENQLHSANNQLMRVGSQSHHAKLNEQKVTLIRKRYVEEDVTMDQLADEYGVTQSVIWRLIRNKSWRSCL